MKRFLSVLLIALCLVAFVSPAHAFHGVRMTYAASGSTGITVVDNNNLDYATDNFFGGVLATIPDYTPSAEVVLDTKHDGSNGRTFSIQTNGKLRLTINANNYDSTVATGLTDGTQHFLSYSVTRETASVAGSVRFEVDGVTLGTAVTITAGAPATVSNAVAQYILGTASKREVGTASKFYSYNRALTTAEVLSLYQSGVATADQWGSQTAKYTSVISADADGWVVGENGSVSGNVDGIGGQNDWLRFTCNTSAGYHWMKRTTPALTLGKKYRLTLTYYIPSGQSNVDRIRAYDSSGLALYLGNQIVTDTATTVTTEFTPTNNGLGISLHAQTAVGGNFTDAGGDDVFYVKNIVITTLGATLDLEPAGIGAASWTDSSSNGLNASYPASGYSLFYNGQRNLLGVGQ